MEDKSSKSSKSSKITKSSKSNNKQKIIKNIEENKQKIKKKNDNSNSESESENDSTSENQESQFNKFKIKKNIQLNNNNEDSDSDFDKNDFDHLSINVPRSSKKNNNSEIKKKSKNKIVEKKINFDSDSKSESESDSDDNSNKNSDADENANSDNNSDDNSDDNSDSDNKKIKIKKNTNLISKTSVKNSILKEKKTKIPNYFKIEKLIKNKKTEKKYLIISEPNENKYFKEDILHNLTKDIKKLSIDFLSYKKTLDIILKILNDNLESSVKKNFNKHFSSYEKIFLISENPLTIFLTLSLCESEICCLYKILPKYSVKFLFNNIKNDYNKNNINLDLKLIKEHYKNFINSNNTYENIHDIINNDISIEINNLLNYNYNNYFSGLNYIEEEILYFILKNNIKEFTLNLITGYLQTKINYYFKSLILSNVKNFIKKLYENFFYSWSSDINSNVKIFVNLKKLKQIFIIYKYYELKKKLLIISLIPIYFIEYSNFLKYDIKDIFNYFKNNFSNELNINKYYEKFNNIKLEVNNKNITLTYNIINENRIDFSNIYLFNKTALIQKCMKLDKSFYIENNIFTFSINIDDKKIHIQKKILKPNIKRGNKNYTYVELDEKFEKNCEYYYNNLINFIYYIYLVKKYINNQENKNIITELSILNNNNILYNFPIYLINDKNDLKNYDIEIKNFNYETINENDENEIKSFIKNYLNELYNYI